MSLSNIISGRFNKSGEPFRGIDALREMIVEEKIWYSKPSDFIDPFEFQNIKFVDMTVHIDQSGTSSVRTMELNTMITLRNRIYQ